MIEYKISDRIIPNELGCFFQDWKSPPSIKVKGKLLNGADLIITARENGKLIGFLTAISDGVMHAFITLVEVTLSGGARQYDTEGEPVTRHIGRIQYQETQQNNPRAVYGLFIAPSINPNTRHYFYVHLKHVSNPQFGGYLNIIPLTLDQFIDIFRFCRNFPDFNRSVIKDLYDRIVELKNSTNDADEWENQICSEIEVWKTSWRSEVTTHV